MDEGIQWSVTDARKVPTVERRHGTAEVEEMARLMRNGTFTRSTLFVTFAYRKRLVDSKLFTHEQLRHFKIIRTPYDNT